MIFDKFPIKSISLGEKGYPRPLSALPNPPKTLYYRGTLSDSLFDKCLGVVGSRKISPYGVAVMERLFTDLSDLLTTVSGFMRGVDINAHNLSIEYLIPTIAVLPCGICETYPSSSMILYQKILEGGGLVISEYPKNEKPRDWMFVKRNRIVAGLCSHLLVVEAGEKSGSLITYEYAKRYGKKILAVPGDIFREGQQGICHILRENAKPVFSGSDINLEMGLASTQNVNRFHYNLSVDEEKVFSSITNSPSDLNNLSRELLVPVGSLGTFVTNLQLYGLIKEIKGVFYAVKS